MASVEDVGAWSSEGSILPHYPCGHVVAEGIQEGWAHSGPGALACCLYVQKRLGIPFGSDTPLLRRRAAPLVGHEPGAAVPLTLKLWLHWDRLISHENEFVRWMSAACCLFLVGVLRCAHLQRSSDFTVEGKGTFARASRAKSSGLAGCLLFGAAPRGDLAAV